MVNTGRLEFVNGGWSMHDEACTHYEDMILNMQKGHKFLMDEFGVRPRIGWHIDPFGHSNANPRLFAEMGFDAWFFSRLDYQDKLKRLNTTEMEFIWRPFFDHLGERAQIFSHVMYNNYASPPGFDADVDGPDDPFVDNANLTSFNAEAKSV